MNDATRARQAVRRYTLDDRTVATTETTGTAKSAGKATSNWLHSNPNPRKWTADYVKDTSQK